MKVGNQKMVRKTNQKIILDTIRLKGSCSRADLAKSLNLSPPSISSNIEQLLSSNLIKEVGTFNSENSKAGRKAILLEFNKNYGFIIGIDLRSHIMRISLGNLSGEIVDEKLLNISNGKHAERLLNEITSGIESLLYNNKIDKDLLRIISIGSPGVIDEKSGKMMFAPQFEGWEEINLKNELNKLYDTKVIIKNDVNMCAIGESHYGLGREHNDLIYINVDLGVGAGIVLNGKLYEGCRMAAGELGTFIKDEAALKSKGYKNLEQRISIPAILDKLNSLGHGFDKFDSLAAAYQADDDTVVEVIEKAADQLSINIANIIMLLDLPLIVLGGEITNLGDKFLNRIQHNIERVIPLPVMIEYSLLQDKAGILGSFVIALDYYFEHLF